MVPSSDLMIKPQQSGMECVTRTGCTLHSPGAKHAQEGVPGHITHREGSAGATQGDSVQG